MHEEPLLIDKPKYMINDNSNNNKSNNDNRNNSNSINNSNNNNIAQKEFRLVGCCLTYLLISWIEQLVLLLHCFSLTNFWQCSHIIPPEKVRKPLISGAFRGHYVRTLAKNELDIVSAKVLRQIYLVVAAQSQDLVL